MMNSGITFAYPFKGIYIKNTLLSTEESSINEFGHFLMKKFKESFADNEEISNLELKIGEIILKIHISKIDPLPNRIVYKVEDMNFITNEEERRKIVDQINEEDSMSYYEVYIQIYDIDGRLYKTIDYSGHQYSEECKECLVTVRQIFDRITSEFGGPEYQEPLQRSL